MLGIAALLAAPISSSESRDMELGNRIPYTVVDQYQECVADLPSRVRTQDRPMGEEFVKEYFAEHDNSQILSRWIFSESSYNPLALRGDAAGLSQLRPLAARSVGLRTASKSELSCLMGLDEDSTYAALLLAARNAVLQDALPYEVLSHIHEPFDPHKSLAGGLMYLNLAAFRGDLEGAFGRYHGGPNQELHGPRTRRYVEKILTVQ